jgi:hypothetical protein
MKHRLPRIAWEYHINQKEEESREDQESGGLLSRNRPWGLDHEDDKINVLLYNTTA